MSPSRAGQLDEKSRFPTLKKNFISMLELPLTLVVVLILALSARVSSRASTLPLRMVEVAKSDFLRLPRSGRVLTSNLLSRFLALIRLPDARRILLDLWGTAVDTLRQTPLSSSHSANQAGVSHISSSSLGLPRAAPTRPEVAAWTSNQLLNRLPPVHYRRFLTSLAPYELRLKKVLYETGAKIEHYYFPISGCLSALNTMADERAIEVGITGSEGVAPFPLLGNRLTSPNKIIVRVPGQALRIPVAVFQEEVRREGPLLQIIVQYQAAFLRQISQSVACNSLHTVQQRCCRWLLSMLDKTPQGEPMPLTHELFAIMLGVRRSSVTEVLNPLQKRGLVTYHRGKITVVDRAGLEALCCECYQTVRTEYLRLLSPDLLAS